MRAWPSAFLMAAITCIDASHCLATERPKFYGRLALGSNFGARGQPNVLHETVLEAEVPTSPSMRARVEAGADQDDLELGVKEAFLEVREPCAPHRFRAGRNRKVLGWHYEHSSSERLGIDLDPPNAFLKERAFTNRDYTVSWDWRRVEETCGTKEHGDPPHPLDILSGTTRLRAGLSAFFSQANDYSLVGHGLLRAGTAWRFGAWLLGESRETSIPHRPLIVWAAAASALYLEGLHRAEAEAWVGEDPLASELAHVRGAPKVRFSAAVLRYALLLGEWSPYLTGSMLVQDLSRTSRTLAAAGGLRYYFDPRLSVTVEARHETWRGIGHTPDDTRGQILGRYYF